MSLLTLPKPDEAILGRRDEIIRQLRKLAPNATLITDSEGRRTFETDALTAYRCMPLAVVLPSSTEEVSAILRYCHDNKIKVVPRGAGTSLSGGALPLEDSIVIGITRMTRVLAIDEANRVARVETGITNIAITNAAAVHGFFYAPDPSSQLACTLGGNIATNSGGAHCLKYGVTTNNLLGLRMVMMNGEVIDIGGDYLDAPGYDFLGLIVGSEGQFGVVTEATVRILKSPEGARPMLLGFDSSEAAGACVAGIIAAGIVPVAIEFMDKPAIQVCENFAGAGYPLDVEALLIVEVEGSARRDRRPAPYHRRDRRALSPPRGPRQQERRGERGDLEGPQGSLRRHRPDLRLLLHGRGHPAVQAVRGADRDRPRSAAATASAWSISSMPATAICIRSSSTTPTTGRSSSAPSCAARRS